MVCLNPGDFPGDFDIGWSVCAVEYDVLDL